MKLTKVDDFIGGLNAGIFEQQLGLALSDVATAATTHGKAGEITIKLKISQIGDTSQVNIAHSMAYKAGTQKGHRSELIEGTTPMHVLSGGEVSLTPTPVKQKDYSDLA